ncbi:twin-arginine translocase subunit TatC [Bacteroides sp. 214]|uniref:twin-arginine translocase subunit TatC n=1 Tax=Bacteroides sp. 214 TaxID=2302935 RepID=UPI0013D41E5A|nr:twin-arginine translocase subunit TatC [Bacteroides sp. 214]NDW13018.1 twin-arginine translocase subunit TatC [Bacteroides sp. 214]
MTNKKHPNELSFWDHLDELRKLLFRLIGIWGILGVAFFVAMPYIFDKVILAPCRNDFVFYSFLRWIGETFNLTGEFFIEDFHVNLININLAAPFFVHITTAFWLAVVVAIPFLFYEVWRFIRPALYKNEKKGVRKAFVFGAIMFYLGLLVGYYMVYPLTLRFLSTYQLTPEVVIVNQISLNSYIDNFMMLVLCMGIAFELPLVTWLLSLLGIVNKAFLKKYRRHAAVAIVAVSAVVTPTGDPFTLTAVSLPLYLLYELSILMVKDRKGDEDEEEEDDEEQ